MSDPSITSWVRLEPQARDPQMTNSLKARLLDPLWLLSRQWQMGEFQAEDSGTPVLATMDATTATLTRQWPGPLPADTQATAAAFDPLAQPLEALIERRPMRAEAADDLRLLPFSADAGQHFLRMLAAQATSRDYRDIVTAHFALQLPTGVASDEPTRRFIALMAGRVPDGRRLAAAFRAGIEQVVADAALGIEPGDRAKVITAATGWLVWYDGFCSQPANPADTWVADRLEYALTLTARISADPMDEINLTASGIDDGRVDWCSFDLNAEVNLGSLPDRRFVAKTHTAVPAPVTFRGAPAPRYWEMEEAGLAYGLMPVGPTDLAQLMAIEYASSFGNDWFVVPLTLPIGSVTRIDSLVITDSFGVRTMIRPIGDSGLAAPGWSMWSLDHIRYPGEEPAPLPHGNLFFLPSTAGRLLDGPMLEDVFFARDEMANMAWAMERSIESPMEQAMHRPGDLSDTSSDLPTGGLRYRLASTVPENWIPLLPVQRIGADGKMIQRLRRGAILEPDGSQISHPAQGDILAGVADLLLFDEEIPREGLRLTRNRRMARWIDGGTWLWTAYRRQIGKGEGSGGLRFDQLDPAPS
ncbi:hypothetical protein MWN34_14485 [Ancylobacter sp. 6x-1]|uniref:Phage tail protein n=1 Tax=Ancylobacter crimeensis TaxID=2579147 RepID=A0ABT0DDR6_9HYPH|nr:hypothetical protein [Ancylobacter crimeensis]MCK0198118.1 hypothetical protein [Ancylobacter crimeensis]